MERIDNLRRRPNSIRYHFLAVGEATIHIGLSHAGLQKARKKDVITQVFVTDLVTKIVQEVDPDKFLNEWRANYQNSEWEYKER